MNRDEPDCDWLRAILDDSDDDRRVTQETACDALGFRTPNDIRLRLQEIERLRPASLGAISPTAKSGVVEPKIAEARQWFPTEDWTTTVAVIRETAILLGLAEGSPDSPPTGALSTATVRARGSPTTATATWTGTGPGNTCPLHSLDPATPSTTTTSFPREMGETRLTRLASGDLIWLPAIPLPSNGPFSLCCGDCGDRFRGPASCATTSCTGWSSIRSVAATDNSVFRWDR